MSINTNTNASDPITKKQQISIPGVLNKESQKKENTTEEIQNEDTILNEQEQNQVVNSEDQEEYNDGADINNTLGKSISPKDNLKNSSIEFENNPGDKDDEDDDDDDDDDNEPERDIEIGDDPDETKKKIPVM